MMDLDLLGGVYVWIHFCNLWCLALSITNVGDELYVEFYSGCGYLREG